jgi:membrane protein DedA with SNARE-associated domain
MGATLVGFGLGRRGGALLDRRVSERERERANRLLERWGVIAIVVTRPVPLLAETTAVLAGASSLGWQRATLAALAGAVPTAVIYALSGSLVVAHDNGALVFIATLTIVAGAWLGDRYLARRVAWNRGKSAAAGSSS